jgi:hypothetical protein
MKTLTIRAKNVVEHKGFILGEGAEVYVDGHQGVPGDFVIVDDDGRFVAVIDVGTLATEFNVLRPRGRKPKAPPFASPEQPPVRQVTVEEHLAAQNDLQGEGS